MFGPATAALSKVSGCEPLTHCGQPASSCPRDYRWHSWKNATQMPAIIARLTRWRVRIAPAVRCNGDTFRVSETGNTTNRENHYFTYAFWMAHAEAIARQCALHAVLRPEPHTPEEPPTRLKATIAGVWLPRVEPAVCRAASASVSDIGDRAGEERRAHNCLQLALGRGEAESAAQRPPLRRAPRPRPSSARCRCPCCPGRADLG